MTGSFQAVDGGVTFHDVGIGNRNALVGTISDVNIFITHIDCWIYRVFKRYWPPKE